VAQRRSLESLVVASTMVGTSVNEPAADLAEHDVPTAEPVGWPEMASPSGVVSA
jgi:hypothetical protein